MKDNQLALHPIKSYPFKALENYKFPIFPPTLQNKFERDSQYLKSAKELTDAFIFLGFIEYKNAKHELITLKKQQIAVLKILQSLGCLIVTQCELAVQSVSTIEDKKAATLSICKAVKLSHAGWSLKAEHVFNHELFLSLLPFAALKSEQWQELIVYFASHINQERCIQDIAVEAEILRFEPRNKENFANEFAEYIVAKSSQKQKMTDCANDHLIVIPCSHETFNEESKQMKKNLELDIIFIDEIISTGTISSGQSSEFEEL